MPREATRTWVWIALAVQLAGYLFDVLWHGVLRPGQEPRTVSEMVRHLATVHLPLYLGAIGVLVATAAAWLHQSRAVGIAAGMAVGGAMLSVAAEAWHAYSHLQMDTHSAPIAGSLSFVGYLVAVTATWRAA